MDHSRSRTLEVCDPKRAALLLDAKTLRYLGPFMGEGRSAVEAARALGVGLNTLLYWVRRLLGAELLEVAHEIPRTGRGIKIYRARAERFYVPFDSTNLTSVEDLLMQEYGPLYRRILHSFLKAGIQMVGGAMGDFGLVVFADADGRLVSRHAPHPDRTINFDLFSLQAPAILLSWQELRLEFADAKAMQRELEAVFARYRDRAGSGSYLAHVALTPINPANP